MDIENSENGFYEEKTDPEAWNIPQASEPPREVREKAKLKQASNAIGFALLAETIVVFLFNTILRILLLLDIKSGILRQIIFNPAVLHVQQIVIQTISFTLPILLVMACFKYNASEYIEFKKPEKRTFLPLFVIGIAFCAFANIATSIAGSVFEGFGVEYQVSAYDNPKGFFGFLLSLLSIVIVPALVEEFLYRGVILGVLKGFGEGFSIVVSAILFGVMHGNFEQMPFAFLVGLVLGYVTVKSGTILTAVAVHGFNNLIYVLSDYVLNKLPNEVQSAVYNLYLVIALLLGILMLLRFTKENSGYFEFEKKDFEVKEKEKYKIFLTTVPILIFIILNVLNSLKFLV